MGWAMFLFLLLIFLFFLLYGSWEALDSSKILPRGTPTFSTPGKAIPRLFEKSIFWIPNGPGPMDPMGMAPWAWAQWAWAHGPNGHGPMGPMGQGPWARTRAHPLGGDDGGGGARRISQPHPTPPPITPRDSIRRSGTPHSDHIPHVGG